MTKRKLEHAQENNFLICSLLQAKLEAVEARPPAKVFSNPKISIQCLKSADILDCSAFVNCYRGESQ